jgi:hypothetical protein
MAINPTQVLGVATIELAGAYMPSGPGASLEPGGLARTTKLGDQVHGPTATARQSKLTATFAAQAGVDVNAVNAFRGGMIMKGDNGITYSVSDMWCMGDARVTAGPSGEISATFEGTPAQIMGVPS